MESTETTNDNSDSGGASAIAGASVVGAVAGLALLGPLAGVVAAGGAAYAAATQKDTVLGKTLQGTGSVVAKAGSAAKKFDDEHNIVSQAASGVAKGVGWVAKQTLANSAAK